MSPSVQALLSLHVAVLARKTQPLAASHESDVHALPSMQVSGLPATHVLSVHESASVHALLSLQDNVLAMFSHPVSGWQASLVQPLPSSQLVVVPAVQSATAHVSPVVQRLPSSQSAVFARKSHPVAASQVSSVQTLPSVHTLAGPEMQLPPAHASLSVHTLPSEHGSELSTLLQPFTASQLSVVHGLPSSQAEGALGVQLPSLHTSPGVQLLLSLQVAVLLACVQPEFVSHASSVQGSPSSHPAAEPDTQMPAPHLSPTVQALPSLHTVSIVAV